MSNGKGRLEGKVSIVTGAGSSGPGVGTGRAMSILFAREGANVILVDQNLESAQETLATIQAGNGEGLVVQGDVTRADDCQKIVEATIAQYGRSDILVHNVGTAGPDSVVDIDEEYWDRVLNLNLKSVMLMSKFVIPRMAANGGAVDNQHLVHRRPTSCGT